MRHDSKKQNSTGLPLRHLDTLRPVLLLGAVRQQYRFEALCVSAHTCAQHIGDFAFGAAQIVVLLLVIGPVLLAAELECSVCAQVHMWCHTQAVVAFCVRCTVRWTLRVT